MDAATIKNPTTDNSWSKDKPKGFSLWKNAVSEEAWEEIRVYLGLTTSPCHLDQTDETKTSRDDIDKDGVVSSIRIRGFGGDSNETDGVDSSAAVMSATTTTMTTTTTTTTTSKTQIPWESTPSPQNRPVAQFGFRYDYEKDVVVPQPTTADDDVGGGVPQIPDVFRRLLLQPHQNDIKRKLKSISEFTQCIVNVYRPTVRIATNDSTSSEDGKTTTTTLCSSIPWHVDDPDFGPEILVYTFGETRPLHMRLEHHDNIDKDNNACNETNDCNDGIYGNPAYIYFTAHPSHRSCYVLSGPARYNWQHSVPSGSGWRVSITFRTLREH